MDDVQHPYQVIMAGQDSCCRLLPIHQQEVG